MDSTSNERTASTELLVHGDSSWSEAGPLPVAMTGLRVVSLNNQIISTGENISRYRPKITNPHLGGWDGTVKFKTIVKFDTISLSWTQVGEMTKSRSYHGASVVKVKDVDQFCVYPDQQLVEDSEM